MSVTQNLDLVQVHLLCSAKPTLLCHQLSPTQSACDKHRASYS